MEQLIEAVPKAFEERGIYSTNFCDQGIDSCGTCKIWTTCDAAGSCCCSRYRTVDAQCVDFESFRAGGARAMKAARIGTNNCRSSLYDGRDCPSRDGGPSSIRDAVRGFLPIAPGPAAHQLQQRPDSNKMQLRSRRE